MNLPDKNKSLRLLLILIAAVLIAGASLAGVKAAHWFVDNKLPAFSNGGEIQVREGETLDQLMSDLEKTFHPLHARSLMRALEQEDVSERLHPGSYRFKPTHTARFVARSLTRGWQTPVRLTISCPIRSREVLASRISSQMMVDSVSVLSALNDSLLLEKFGTTPSHLFEIILPDTYEVYWDWDMEKILNRLRKEYDLFWNKDRQAKAQAHGLTPAQVSVLASIVAEESNKADEYPKVASVYINRLHKGMKLQACPTVCYIYNYSIRRVLYRHLENPSPYNTYMYAGLPPTPICLPEKVHIEAVLNPDPHNYLYFCADPSFNGRNIFSESYSEHTENARKYHEAFEQLQARKAALADSLAAVEPIVIPE